MPLRRPRLLLLLALGGVVLSACRTTTPRPAIAASESDAMLERRAEAHARYAEGVMAEMNGRMTNALESYHRAALLDPRNEELLLNVARRWLLQKQPARALEVLQAGARQPEAPAMVDVLLGTSYAALGQSNLAQQASQRAIRKSPALLAGHQNLYTTLLAQGRTNEAWAALETAARVKAAEGEFFIGLAELMQAHGLVQPSVRSNAQSRALGLLRQAESLALTNVATRVRLADGFNVLGEPAKAAELYQKLLEDFPQAPMLQENLRAKLTDIYLRGKDRKRAIEQLEVITRSDPMNVQAHYFLGLLSAETGDAANAEEHYRKVVVLNPKFEQAHYDLAMSQLANGRTNEVMQTLRDAQKRFGENFISEFLLGIAHLRVGAYGESIKHFTGAEVIARATDPKRLNEQFYFHFGSALERKGDYSQAVSYLEKALAAKPEFPEAANYLGYMWAERGENLERALELIQRAVQAEPKNPAYLDSLAWVLFKLGRPQEALPPMLKAVELAAAEADHDPTLYDHLGDIQAALGNLDAARKAWQKAVSFGADDAVRKKLAPSPAAHP